MDWREPQPIDIVGVTFHGFCGITSYIDGDSSGERLVHPPGYGLFAGERIL